METSLRRVFGRTMRQAARGRTVWRRLLKDYDIKNDLVLLLPTDNSEYNYYSLANLGRILQTRGLDTALIVTENETVKKYAPILCNRIKEAVSIGERDQQALLRFNSLYDMGSRFAVGSPEHPNGRAAGMGMLNVDGISVEKLMVMGVFHLFPFRHAEIELLPDGDMPEDLQAFLRVPAREGECRNG